MMGAAARSLNMHPADFDQMIWPYEAFVRGSPHAGQVSRELRDKAAKASYDENGGNDEYEWEDAPEPQKTWSYQQVDVVFAALGLSVEERTDADNS